MKDETLSAMFDGEANDFELRRGLQTLSDDDRKTWQRYAQVSHAIKNAEQENTPLAFDISASIAQAIDQEPVHSLDVTDAAGASNAVSASDSRKKWISPVVGFASAASIAFAAVVGINYQQQADEGFVADGLVNVAPAMQNRAVGLNTVSQQVQSQKSLLQDIERINQQKMTEQERFNYYMRRHVEHSSMQNGQGLVPMVRHSDNQY